VIDALNMAAWTRRLLSFDQLTCHTDAGSQGEFNWSSQHLDEKVMRREKDDATRCSSSSPFDAWRTEVSRTTV
jgi:hypothetical protein